MYILYIPSKFDPIRPIFLVEVNLAAKLYLAIRYAYSFIMQIV